MIFFGKKKTVYKYKDESKQREFEEAVEQELKNAALNPKKELQAKYVEFLETEQVNKHYILYEAYGGRGMICSPYTIFKYLLNHKKFKKYVHIWVIEDFEDNRHIMERYANYENVRFVEYQSIEYLKYLAAAKYLLNNVTFPGYFTKRKEQIYINSWHGIPLKTVAYDAPGGNINAGNTARNFLAADYILSMSDFMTETYKKAFRLDGIFEGTILQEGQPRNDGYFHTERAEIIRILQQHGVEVDANKKIIMYAPTWKGDKYTNPDVGLENYFEIIRRIKKNIDTERYQVLVKPHQIVYKYIKNREEINGKFIPAIIDTNEILSVTDILISDYSSIYFDYLVSDKPIVFFIPDLAEYQDKRGLYFGTDKLPGPIAQNYEQLEEIMRDVDKAMEPYWAKYREEKAWACPMDDGAVCERVVNTVFFKKNSLNAKKCDVSKKKIVLYGGTLETNGITFSLLALFGNIDYNKYDVTLLVKNGIKNEEVVKRVNEIDKRVRVLYRMNSYNASYEEEACHKFIMEHGMDAGYIVPEDMYKREWRRTFGDAKMDCAIEFCGLSGFFSVFFAHAEHAKKLIWMHSDLSKELVRGEKGGFDLGKGLRVVISAYPYYDRIVGCSKAVMELNKAELGTKTTENKFVFAGNLINYARIEEQEQIESIFKVKEESYFIVEKPLDSSRTKLVEVLPAPGTEAVNFVTMGRLSPEKNQDNLIKAFARLYKEHKNIRLYLLGEGPWREKLEKLAEQEQLQEVVHLVGILPNPFGFLKHCNCFILPSHYEGQPLVIQEVRALKMPIIVSKFETVRDVCIEKGQLLVGQEAEELYAGMKAFLNGEVPEYEFDCKAYNRKVYQEFEHIIDEL